ncbi:zinc-binding alcohol dehydrogenase family protein [Stakelama saccharophila]|uniref:Zinc-binding alcohol dehydrogenase family protein n=1 Tax=Stakelama saccharophila TaxID=3075605 RepID=A0ABZ0B5A6_9SPHN|nr:zinc-binding alcohol dehydrogenase family protein [Stakelama sp. W311]WNO52377.1 zinc-binding alcohol dehydrogenase family protein [Stakelama sp. W311]
MKAVVCERPFALDVRDRPLPERAPGEVLLRIRRIGLCGTDYHIFAGNQPFLSYPRVMGHELAGEVVEADMASGLVPGAVVTLNPYLPCGECIACRKDKPNCCTSIRVLGVHVDGGMCEYLAVPQAAVIPAGTLSLDQAAMVEFLSVGAHAVRRGETTAGDHALVVGAGPIGVAVALFAKAAGAGVTIADTSRQRLDYARDAIGIPDGVLVDDTIEATLAERTDGEFYDLVFDATGNARAMEKGFAFVAHGGSYVLVSVVKQDISFADPEFHKREMRLIGSRNATAEDFRTVIAAITRGDIPTDTIKTHAFPMAEAPSRFPELIADQGSVLKAIAIL